MERCFITVLNMSLAASVVILLVMAVRVFFRRAPKLFSYALWGIVLFRLLCPISFSADFSVFNLFGGMQVEHGQLEFISYDEGNGAESGIVGEAEKLAEENLTESLSVTEALTVTESSTVAEVSGQQESTFVSATAWGNDFLLSTKYLKICTSIWIIGIIGFLLHSVFSMLRLRKQLRSAVCEENNIYRSNLMMPFVYGIFSPKIYIPAGIEGGEKECILLHEQIHIRRGDHLIKLISNLVLWVHWFNPLVWVAFFLCEKDMEMSCDEAVVRRLGSGVKKEYAASLLALSVGEGFSYSLPPAFGEGDAKGRIQNILRYRKRGGIIPGAVFVFCFVLAVVSTANPSNGRKEEYAAAFAPPIKGISWGMSPEEVAEKLDTPEDNISRGDLGQVQMVCKNQTVFGQKGDVTLLFDMSRGEPGLLELWISFEDFDREELYAKLLKEYGERIAANPDKWGSETVEDLPQEVQDKIYYVKVEVPSQKISTSEDTFSKETVWNSLKRQPLVTVTLGENTLSYNAQNMAGYLIP